MATNRLKESTKSKIGQQNVESWKISDVTRKYPTYRNSILITIESWLKGKQTDNGAEGLWRIYDNLYDFTYFIEHHPGGAFWLQATKGTYITEPFESHHISSIPEKILDSFKIRSASEPRNYKFTFHEDGFYKTLKRRVRAKLKEIDQIAPKRRTNLMHLVLLLFTILLALVSAKTSSIMVEFPTALALCWLTIAAHNYFHQHDNWQMYTFNFSLMNFNCWRISHVLSHHVYPNSLLDLEMSLYEPFLSWLPNKYYGSKLKRYVSLGIQPLVYVATIPLQFLIRLMSSLLHSNTLYWHDIIGFILPTLMWLVSNASILIVLRQWFFIISLCSFLFAAIAFNAGHHGPEIYHDGDANRVNRDWGLYQLDTIADRGDIKSCPFMVLTHFGEHALHHLFPTLDHGVLPQIYPEFTKTLLDFDEELRESNSLKLFIDQNQQLLRTEANRIAPGK